MNAILAKYLKDFSVPEPVATISADDLFADGEGLEFPGFDEMGATEPPVDVEALCDEARQEGFDTASAELGRVHETEIATLISMHSGEIEDLRAAFEKQISKMVHDRFEKMTRTLADSLSQNVMEILLPILDEKIAARTVGELAANVSRAVSDEKVSEVIVRGPARLFTALQEELKPAGIACRHIDDDGMDISIEVDKSVLASRLNAWKDGVAEILS